MTEENDNLEVIANRLATKPTIKEIRMHVEWHRSGRRGEYDLDITTTHDTLRYYEYKRTGVRGAIKRAYNQFKRDADAHPLSNRVYILITGTIKTGYHARHYHRDNLHALLSLQRL